MTYRFTRVIFILSLLALGCSSEQSNDVGFDQLQGPDEGYYDSVVMTGSAAMRASLHEIIDDHRRFELTDDNDVDIWDIIEQADRDPDPNAVERVLDVYRNASYPRARGSNPFYHREHVWPKSVGFPVNGDGNYPYTDAHHLMIADGNYNMARGDRHFATCTADCTDLVTEVNINGGGATDANRVTSQAGVTGAWEVWSKRRGDIARAMFYMDVRYEGDTHSETQRTEPQLILTNELSRIVADPGNSQIAYMGLLDTLIQWHKDDPVDDNERWRNDVIEFYQGNRNPFIDHPEFVECVFELTCDDDPPPPELPDPWINELHYDNDVADVDEGVEIAGPAGTDLANYTLIAYNGSNGQISQNAAPLPLSGLIPNQSGNGGTIFFPLVLENGEPDGVALIDPDGNVLQLLSYDGQFTATEGAAMGVLSTDIGVSEPSDTPVDQSLQVTGTGCSASDFAIWEGPVTQTRDLVNANQTLACPAPQ